MKSVLVATKPIALLAVTLGITISLIILHSDRNPPPKISEENQEEIAMAARSFVLWLHGLGDSGPANEPIKNLFTSPEFRNTRWSFPSAPSNPVSCNYGAVMPSWFDIHEIPVAANSPKDESGVLKAVQHVHAMIDKEVAAGTSPSNILVCGFSQGGLALSRSLSLRHIQTHFSASIFILRIFAGALTLASILLYLKTLGGGADFSGWVPFNSSIIDQIAPEAKKVKIRHIKGVQCACVNPLLSCQNVQTPILWSHGIADRTVLSEAGQAGPPFLEQTGLSCEFKFLSAAAWT